MNPLCSLSKSYAARVKAHGAHTMGLGTSKVTTGFIGLPSKVTESAQLPEDWRLTLHVAGLAAGGDGRSRAVAAEHGHNRRMLDRALVPDAVRDCAARVAAGRRRAALPGRPGPRPHHHTRHSCRRNRGVGFPKLSPSAPLALEIMNAHSAI